MNSSPRYHHAPIAINAFTTQLSPGGLVPPGSGGVADGLAVAGRHAFRADPGGTSPGALLGRLQVDPLMVAPPSIAHDQLLKHDGPPGLSFRPPPS